MTRLRVAFAGTPEFAVPALQALAGSHNRLVGVLTRPDRPKGRGLHLAASPVKLAALEAGLPVSQPESLASEAGRRDLVLWNPDVLVVVAYGLILPPEVLALPRLGCVNIHASLLPRWRGAAPIQRAILAGDEETGVTLMLMDAGLDTGPMLLQRRLRIAPDETAGSLHGKLAQLGADALIEALDGLAEGSLRPQPQPQEGVTYAKKLTRAEALIDWSARAIDIERRVRALDPWPIAETRYRGEPVRIRRARAESGSAAEPAAQPPGTVLGLTEQALVVQCGQGRLEILEVQRPGRRAIAARDYANSVSLIGQQLG